MDDKELRLYHLNMETCNSDRFLTFNPMV